MVAEVLATFPGAAWREMTAGEFLALKSEARRIERERTALQAYAARKAQAGDGREFREWFEGMMES